MARLLFGIGAQGPLILELQAALKNKGFDPKGADGQFGRDTEAAVKGYQSSVAHPATGGVTDEEWTPLTGTPVPGMEARCLQLTATFEGHGYTLAKGNWDDAWVTWGIIGFTLKHGEIQKIVFGVEQKAPARIQEAFGADADALLAMMRASPPEQEDWANRITVGAELAEPWRTGFQRFGAFPEVQAEQRMIARADYFVPAARTAGELKLASELGLALCFDIQVQNGGVKQETRQAVAPLLGAADELAIREAVANGAADTAKPRYREDVRARKLAIARGEGEVHGRRVILANWGLAAVPASE